MHLTRVINLAAEQSPTLSELVTPYIPVLVIILGSIIVGIFNRYNNKKGNVETRAPDVNEIWQQQAMQSKELDMERKLRRTLEDMYRDLRRVFMGYVLRVQNGGNTELNTREQKAVDTKPPTTSVSTQE
jgi:hypothetical protein